MDSQGGVHFYFDAEFQRCRAATLAFLGTSAMANVRHAFDRCYWALDAAPPDTLIASRAIFEALEIAVKALLPNAGIARLGASEVNGAIRTKVLEAFPAEPARNNASEMVNGLRSWVNGLQAYRHGQDTPEPTMPPLPLALALISNGASYLRFLVEVLGPKP
jgi:hypothetical protein